MGLRIYFLDVDYIHFVWDEAKNRVNQRNHGIPFREERAAFFDENARVLHDPEHFDREDRIIPARRASHAEAQQYTRHTDAQRV
jgi:uncharacterized DUF497 family protein